MTGHLDAYAPCLHCHAVRGSAILHGALRLCPPCAAQMPTQPCAEGTHTWRGGNGTGQWWCWTCGAVLTDPPADAPSTFQGLDASDC